MMRLLDRVLQFGPVLAGFMILGAALLVCLELFLRNVFVISLAGADEISAYLFAVGMAWTLPYVILTDANVRIEALVQLIPQPFRGLVLRLGIAVFAVFLAVLAFRAVQMAWLSGATNAHSVTPLQTPLVIPQSFWAFGLCVSTLVAVIVMFFGRVTAGDSTDSEIEEFTEAAKGGAADDGAHNDRGDRAP